MIQAQIRVNGEIVGTCQQMPEIKWQWSKTIQPYFVWMTFRQYLKNSNTIKRLKQ